MHDLAINNKENPDTTACCAVQTRKNPCFHSAQTDWCCTDSGTPEPKVIYGTSPGPALPTDATPRTRSVLGGHSLRRGNTSGFRRTVEAQGLGAHVARRARTVAPRPRSTRPTSTRSFVSRYHKSRGYLRSRTGLQCGQFIVLEASQRPVIKVYIYAHTLRVIVRIDAQQWFLVFARGG